MGERGWVGWEMGQEIGGRGPVQKESCFSFTTALSSSLDHSVSLKEILESTEEIEIIKQERLMSSSRSIKSHPSVEPLWKIHEVLLQRRGLAHYAKQKQ